MSAARDPLDGAAGLPALLPRGRGWERAGADRLGIPAA